MLYLSTVDKRKKNLTNILVAFKIRNKNQRMKQIGTEILILLEVSTIIPLFTVTSQ